MYVWNVRLSTYRARETIDLLRRSTPDFIAPDMWPPNSPDLNPVDYSIWSVMQQHVNHSRVKDVDELRAFDLRVVRTGPVCCEPRHRQVEASSVGLCPR